MAELQFQTHLLSLIIFFQIFNNDFCRTKVRLGSYFDNGENSTTETNNTSIDEFLETLEGVDPNEPEEIARKEFYRKNMNMFEHILHVNQRKIFWFTNLLSNYCYRNALFSFLFINSYFIYRCSSRYKHF